MGLSRTVSDINGDNCRKTYSSYGSISCRFYYRTSYLAAICNISERMSPAKYVYRVHGNEKHIKHYRKNIHHVKPL